MAIGREKTSKSSRNFTMPIKVATTVLSFSQLNFPQLLTLNLKILSLSKMKPLLPLPYFFLMFFIITNTFCVNIADAIHGRCVEDHQRSLLHLKKSLTFAPELSENAALSKFISWNSSTDCCSWVGVTCNTNGSVVGLDISSQYISGGIDNLSSLFHLQHLQSLNLADNSFVDGSRIPSSIGKLTNLRYLNLSSNSGYSGKIPIEISRLTRLVVLDISLSDYQWATKLESPNLSMLFQNLTEITELYLDRIKISAQGSQWCQAISSSLPDLRVLSLSQNQLSGPFCQSLAKLQSLSVIQLDGNHISGPIPGFFAKFANLTVLNLNYNNIGGMVPRFFANFSKLTSLSLQNCTLNGTFPKEIFQVPTLQTIDLSDNVQLHGSLPEFPENASLQYLDLSYTKFSGLLPDSIGNLKILSFLNLDKCSFSGSIPKSLASLTELVDSDLSSNMFNGSIDSMYWGNLVNLQYFSLESNLLTGSIPLSIFSPPRMVKLTLSHNRFSGQLHEFSNVSSDLFILDLSFNNLEGPIPVSIFNFRGLALLFLSSNNFSSFPFNLTKNMRSLNQFHSLKLAFNNLREVPDFLRNQTELETLDLSGNQIQKVPNWIWSLHSLNDLNLSSNSLITLEVPVNYTQEFSTLDLHSNQLKGSIPLLYSYYLDYSRNYFTSIPNNIADFLAFTTFLSISSNDLHGLIPASICDADELLLLDLSINSLSGTIPQCLYAMEHLNVLILRRNNLTGSTSDLEFPETLEFLELDHNRIDGQFPKFLANCGNLQVVNLENNQITDTFPCWLWNISTLRVLALRSNKFYGRIGCPEVTNVMWPMLQIIDVAHNNFHGEILPRYLETWQAMINSKDDATQITVIRGWDYQETLTVTSKGLEVELVKILTIFTTIDFSCNNFSGPIPMEMGELKSLYFLNLSGNAFTGEIPFSFGNMQQLESLDLSQNKLSGKIPSQLAKLSFLEVLNLSNNQLVGKIPTGPQFSTFTSASFKGNQGLWGPPLTVDSKAGLSPPPTLTRSVPSYGREIDWDLISVEIGFVCGFGVAVGSLVLCKRWSKWYYKTMYKILVKIFPQLEDRIGPHRRHVHINQRLGG